MLKPIELEKSFMMAKIVDYNKNPGMPILGEC